MTILYNASYTKASTVVTAVNLSHTSGVSPLTASLNTTLESGNDGTGVITQTALKLS